MSTIGNESVPPELASGQSLPEIITIPSQPYPFSFPVDKTALLLIDIQRDFLLPNGFGHIQGGDLTHVQAIIPACQSILSVWRSLSLPVIHTREGHVPDLSDCPTSKLHRQAFAPRNKQHFKAIGDKWEMGRLMVRGESGHGLCDEVAERLDEKVIDKPGKGSFWNTTLMEDLISMGITHLIVGGVTTECCVTTTVREANDRGFECCIIDEITAGYNPSFKTSSLDMIHWSQGLFGFVSNLHPLLNALSPYIPSPEPTAPLLLTPASISSFSPGPPDTGLAESQPVLEYPITINSLLNGYKAGLSPLAFFKALYAKIQDHQANTDAAVWIQLLPLSTILARVESLMQAHSDTANLLPLFCIPFSIKDSLDVEGLPTTVACPPITYIPPTSSTVYLKAIAAGAVLIGKTNLDQLATGLTGCRSPYGIPRSIFSKEHISGGSSSGNAISVGARLVSFSIATDTAGSCRIPSAYNEIIGFKPTRGTISAFGVFPACRSLDCVAIMVNQAGGISDLLKVWNVLRGYDEKDIFAKAYPPILRPVNALPITKNRKFRFGVPPPDILLSHCSTAYRNLFSKAVTTLQSLGGKLISIPWEPFHEAGELLYSGTLVFERLTMLPSNDPRQWLEKNSDALQPPVREILRAAVDNHNIKPESVFRDLHRMAELSRYVHERVFTPATKTVGEGEEGIDVLVVPTAPKHPTVKEVLKEPIKRNTELGVFTHFGNVLDLCAISVPAGRYLLNVPDVTQEENKEIEVGESKGKNEIQMPFSVTFLARSRGDGELLGIVRAVEKELSNIR